MNFLITQCILHGVVKRIFEGEGGVTCGTFCEIINLSIGDLNIVFNHKMSPNI